MSRPTETPIITVEYYDSLARHLIMATSYSKTEPAGLRLLRGGEHPDIQFQHATAESAEKDAELLRRYLASLGKPPSKAKLRRGGAD